MANRSQYTIYRVKNPILSNLNTLSLGLISTISGSILLLVLMLQADSMSAEGYNIYLPMQSDWVDCGKILNSGEEGEWDYYLWGGFAASVVKRDETFYLYYQGADGYDEAEGTVTWRAIGLATSSDGFNFSKYAGNPVLTWFPKGNLEEGAVSAGAFLDATGEIVLYYGANTWAGGSSVNADGRLALSADGIHLSDEGIVLYHKDRSVWGAGDELFPVIGFQEGGNWFTYYIPNGTAQKGRLGVAWGNSRDQLPNTAAARTNGLTIPVWGPGSSVRVDQDTYVLFVNDVYRPGGPVLEARVVSLNAPSILSAPVRSYQFDDVWQAIVFFDDDHDRWFMYYRSANVDYYGVKIASADGRPVRCLGKRNIYLPVTGRPQ
jgi:hypothetical protein